MSGQSTAGSDIARAREEIKLSQIGLAYMAGLDLRTIQRIEAGDVEPRRATRTVIWIALDKARAEAATAA